MSSNVEDMVPQDVREQLGWEHMPAPHRAAIAEFGFRMFRLGQYIVEDIDEIKYDGRLVILNDASRWEVDSFDADESAGWGVLDKVVVLDDVMYNIEDAPHVAVTEEL